MGYENMTFIGAAKKILIDCGNLPLTSNQIWEKIKEKGLVNTNGKTPWASLNTILLTHSQNSPVKTPSKVPTIEIIGSNPMKFRLLSLTENINDPNYLNGEDFINKKIEDEKILLYQITSKSLNWKKLSVFNNNENIEYLLSDCEEYTYIMEDKAHATLKIGKTKNDPESRLNQLKTGNPSINILHVFPSTQYSESDLHQRFNDFQKDLEWYFYTKVLKTFLSIEIEKHESIFNSFLIREELNNKENHMLNFLIK
jgi:hypothetical protein